MMELVFWSFVVALPPLVFTVLARILAFSADLYARYGCPTEKPRCIDSHRSQPSNVSPKPMLRRPESFGHGV